MAKRNMHTQWKRFTSLLIRQCPESMADWTVRDWDAHALILCHCRQRLQVRDCDGHSATFACANCGRCYLNIIHPRFACLIRLRTFHLHRGNGPEQRRLEDLQMATQLVECLFQDCWPSPATVVDFGIDSPRHLGALQHAVQSGVKAYDLDRVMGDGPAITRLVRLVPDQPYQQIEFCTAYDDLFEREEEDGEF